MPKPLVIDLFCGRFGWSRQFVREGWRAIGFDIAHEPYHGPVPDGCSLVVQDVITLHGSQFKDASAIVASPPCQKYSYMAMPWTRAKDLAKWYRDTEHPERLVDLNALFNACFRIQREAIAATAICTKCSGTGTVPQMITAVIRHSQNKQCGLCVGGKRPPKPRYIPMVVENVKGAQPWVGPSRAHFGSFHLWGDVESVGVRIVSRVPRFGDSLRPAKAQKHNPDGTAHGQGSWFKIADSKERGSRKNGGGSWFDVAHNKSGKGQNPVNGIKQSGLSGEAWFNEGAASLPSGSSRRKAASAAIAEIPPDLAQWIARCFKPESVD